MPGQVKKQIAYWEDVAKKEAPAQKNPALAQENSLAQQQVAEAPAKQASPLESMLSAHLEETGRVNQLSPESFEKREKYSGEVLQDMEASTQARQRQANLGKAPDAQRPLTHAVSGHGKGTDQVGRLVHGRRNDEMMEDQAGGSTPSSSVSLTGNKHGLGDASQPEYTTVGSDPKNISGAFTTNSGMLHAVESGFSQATMLSSHQEQARRDQAEKGEPVTAKRDQDRFANTVAGPGGDIGYNLTLAGDSQSEGDSVSPSDMQSRYEDIERDDSMKNATVVLDPAFVDGRRAGWQVQTAFANNDAPGNAMSNPEQVGQEVDRMDQKDAAEVAVAEARAKVKAAKDAVAKAKSKAKANESAAKGMKIGIDKKKGLGLDTADMEKGRQAKLDEATKLLAEVPDLEKAVGEAENELAAAEATLASLS